MKKYLEPDLTVIKFSLKDVLNASKPSTTKKPMDPNDPDNDDEYTPWY